MVDNLPFADWTRFYWAFIDGDSTMGPVESQRTLDRVSGQSGGLTPLLDREGKPIISPVINQ